MKTRTGHRRRVRGGGVGLAACAALAPQTAAAPPPFQAGATTFVALPDTQIYAQDFPDTFTAQTQWIVDNREARNIAAVFHLGDITNRNTVAQWQNAQRSLGLLHGVVPYILSQGNHDTGTNGSANNRASLMSSYFPQWRYETLETFGGTMEPAKTENTYHLFEAAGRKWIAIALEWGPRDVAVEWANGLLAEHRDRLAIIVTHAYMYRDNTRMDQRVRDYPGTPYNYGTSQLPGGTSDGGDLYRELVSRHPTVMFAMSGHISGEGRLFTITPFGNGVHEVLADYQNRPGGGEGYLRLLEILPDGRTVVVRTYSPLLDSSLTGPTSQFTLTLRTAEGYTGAACDGDLAPGQVPDGRLDVFDIMAFFRLFVARHELMDRNGDGSWDLFDILSYFEAFSAGCAC